MSTPQQPTQDSNPGPSDHKSLSLIHPMHVATEGGPYIIWGTEGGPYIIWGTLGGPLFGALVHVHWTYSEHIYMGSSIYVLKCVPTWQVPLHHMFLIIEKMRHRSESVPWSEVVPSSQCPCFTVQMTTVTTLNTINWKQLIDWLIACSKVRYNQMYFRLYNGHLRPNWYISH